ncbi:MAG TPA: ABC transporter substrate-binding protein [Gaiellaceae bacterium]|nr:ABC transporter substrate-binding protein [Gaiellaceae bacterium]
MRKHVFLVVAAVAALLSVTTSAVGSSAHRAKGPSGSVNVSVGTDPGSLDPQLTLLSAARYVDSYAYDTLVTLTGPGKVASGVAQSWKVVSPKRVEFTLNKNVTCADGSKMTASVVKQNLDFVGNPANKSPLLGLFVPVGATVTANNSARTVTVATTTPQPFMLQGLALVQLICSKGLADRSLLAHGTYGTGPYSLTDAVPGDHYTFQVRKGYTWGPNGASTAVDGLPAKVTVKVITNETTAANLLLSGGLNLASLAGPDRVRLNKTSLFKIVSPAQPNELFFNENAGHPAANPAVRKALVQALNLNQIGTVETSGLGLKMSQLSLQNFTPCAGNSVAGSVPAYNPSAAKSALGGVSIKVLYPTDAGTGYAPAAELVQQQLSAAGVKVTLDGQSTAALQGKLFGTGDWDLVLIAIGVANPAQFTSLLAGPAPPHGINFAGLANAGYKLSVARATRRVGSAGCQYWLDGERALFKAGDIAPLQVTTSASYGKGVSFVIGLQGPQPTSLRLTKSK